MVIFEVAWAFAAMAVSSSSKVATTAWSESEFVSLIIRSNLFGVVFFQCGTSGKSWGNTLGHLYKACYSSRLLYGPHCVFLT